MIKNESSFSGQTLTSNNLKGWPCFDELKI
jgi:hypothetical protein